MVFSFLRVLQVKQRADERTQTADLIITSVLLTRDGAADACLLMLSTILLCEDHSLLERHETLAEDI